MNREAIFIPLNFKNAWGDYIQPFRTFVNQSPVDIPALYEQFCEALTDTFNLTQTYMLAVSFDPIASEYKAQFHRAPTDGLDDLKLHQTFATRLLSLAPDDWPVRLLTKAEVPEELQELLWPEALGIVYFAVDTYEKSALVFYTFSEQQNAVFSEAGGGFLTAAAGYAMVALQKKLYDNRMNDLLYLDNLTETPNRTYFYHMLVDAIQYADLTNETFAILMMDISKLKQINDTHGYHAGDQLLKELSYRLKSAMGSEGILSRFGGDIFAAYIPDVSNLDRVFDICERIENAVSEPVDLQVISLQPAVKIGISLFPHDGESVDTLFKNAEAAMYQAKKDASVKHRLYNPSITQESGKLLSLSAELTRAIANDEFEMFYQAQLDIHGNRIASAEALIRWRHPTRGILPPFEFIPFAESNGQIVEIDKIVLRKCCEQAKKWHESGYNLTMGINISAEHFRNGAIVGSLEAALAQTGAPPHTLEIEILESTMLEDLDATIDILNRIRALGICVSLDDFGSGYSSLEYITMLPLDLLKIDRGFSMNMDRNPRNKIILRAIILLAREMGFRVIAEGVETKGHLDFLRENGCDYAQGYYINKPMPLHELEQLIAKYNNIEG